MSHDSLSASINLVDLDFNTLKDSFKLYLKSQDNFKDYDFEGSNINVLLDLLAFNTFKNAFYLNMTISEGFLDSAQTRNSLLSHAKELNYLPRSVRSAKANITVDFEATSQSQPYIIQKGAQFSTLIKNRSYVFSIPETITLASSNNSYTFTTDIYEGAYRKDAYVFLDNIDNQRFRITNKNIDTRSLAVTVFEDGSELGDLYLLTTTLLDINETSKVFFLQTDEIGHYEVLFGDNNIGRSPTINSTIILDYRVSNGEDGNGARNFSVDFDPTATGELLSTPTLTVGDVANNGDEQETNESIRYYAPRHFQVQERAVTTSDYEVSLKTQFPEINAVSVFGGEEVSPPQFGRVFVSVDISDVDGLPESKKDEYFDFLIRRSPLSIEPIFVEPEFLYLTISSLVRYNLNITTNSSSRIRTLVTDTILIYQTNQLDDFASIMRLSQLTDNINDTDLSVISNITNVNVYKKLQPLTTQVQNIDIDFGLPLIDTTPNQDNSYLATDVSTIYSSRFKVNGASAVLEDDGNGIIRTVKQDGELNTTIQNVGTVNYDTGFIQLVNFKIDSFDGASLKIYAVTRDKDIRSGKNVILTIEADEIKLTIEPLRL